jgi:hypothetical protein
MSEHLRGPRRSPEEDERQAIWLGVLVLGGLLLAAALPVLLAALP